MPKYFSGRNKRTPQSGLTSDRYQYLSIEQAEPNLGDPPEIDNIPTGNRYQVISVQNHPGERYWLPIGGGVQPGAITVREEETILPTGANEGASAGVSSITDINFKGNILTAVGWIDEFGNPGTGVTITAAPIGQDHEVIFNNNGEFGAASGLSYDNTNSRVGIASTQPDQTLDIDGSLFISGNVFDRSKTNSGSENQVLVRHIDGGLAWADQSTTGVSDAAGDPTQVQYHGSDGKITGGKLLVYDYTNGITDERVGIGSTQPTRLLDVLGDSRFVGVTTFVGNVYVNGVVTSEDVTNIDSLGIVTAQQGFRATDGGLIVVGITTLQNTKILHDNGLYFGADNDTNTLEIKFDGTDSVINDVSSANLGFKLQQDGNTKLEVTQSGIIVTGVTTTDILSVTGLVTSHLIPSPTDVGLFDLGSSTNKWDNIWANNINVGSYSPISLIVEQLKVTGISTLSNLEVSGMSTFIGLSTFSDGLEVISGVTTFSGITTVTGETLFTKQFSVAGVSTLGIASATDLFVSGLSTFVGFSTFKDDVFVAGVSTFIGFTTFRDDIHVTGVSTFVGFSTFQDVIVGGMSTFVGISSFEGNVSFNEGIRDKDGDLGDTGWLLESTGDGKVNWVNPQGLTVENAVKVGIGSTDKDSTYYPTFVKNNNKHDDRQNEYLYNTHDFIYSYDGNAGIGSVGIGTDIIAHNTTLNVTGITSFKGSVYFNGTDENNLGVTSLTWQRSEGRLKFKDEVQAVFGDGNDLLIYHTETLKGEVDNNGDPITDNTRCSYIHEKGSGGLIFKSNGAGGPGAFQFFEDDWKPLVKMHSGNNARVLLYHNGLERLQTIGTGVTITGITTTNSLSVSGISSFWGQVWDETGSPGQPTYLLEATSTGVNWKAPENLTVENANKVGVGTTGAVSTGGTSIYYPTFVDSNNTEGRDLEYLYSGNALTYNVHYVDGNDVGIGSIGIGTTTPNTTLDVLGITSFRGNVYFNGIDDNDGSVGITSITWKPSSSALEFKSNVRAAFGDDSSLTIRNGGASNHSTITHDNSSSSSYLYIESSGNLILESTGVAPNAGYNWLRGVQGGATELYWNANGNKKLETTDAGIKVTGLTTTDSLRLNGPFYDKNNSYGAQSGYILETNQENGVKWVSPGDLTLENANKVGVGSINAADAGIGTHFITFVDTNNPYDDRKNERIYSTGLFVYDPQDGGRVGIGTTIPSDTLSVSGITSFKGEVYFNNDVTGITSIAWKPSSSALEFKDNVKAVFGNDDDLQIYLEVGAGGNPDQSTIYSPNKILSLMSGDRVEIEDEVGNNIAVFHKDGSSDLYYRGTTGAGKKLATSGIGITVTGLTSTTSLMVTGAFYDKDGDSGTEGQVLSSTGLGAVDWIDSDTLSADRAKKILITDDIDADDNSQIHYIHFGEKTSDYDSVKVDSNGLSYYQARDDEKWVGIGTTSPHDSTGNAGGLTLSRGDGQVRLVMKNNDTGHSDGDGSHIVIGSKDFTFENRTSEGHLYWSTNIAATGATADIGKRMTLTPEGHVGIGTTNPISDEITTSLQTNNSVLAVGIVTARDYYGSTLNVYDSDGTNKITLQAPATENLIADYTLTLPVDAGSNDGDVLKTDGNGVLSWTTNSPGTPTAAGDDKQVQFNDKSSGSSVLTGAANLLFDKSETTPTLILSPSNTSTSTNGGYIQVRNAGSTNTTLNAATINAEGGLELKRTNESVAGGGPFIDFKYDATDMDARIQMDIVSGDPSADKFSAIRFLTGGGNIYDGANNPNGRVTEKLRIGKDGEIGIQGGNQLYVSESANPPVVSNTRSSTDIYGSPGQVLKSGGLGASVYWGDGGGGSALTAVQVKQYSDDLSQSDPRTERTCDLLDAPITVATSSGTAVIGIGSTSNAYGNRYIGTTEPTGNLCEGDIWYDTSASAGVSDSTGITKVALLEYRTGSGVDDLGSITPNTWTSRALSYKVDPQSFVTFPLDTDTATTKTEFSLGSGTYRIKWSVPAVRMDRHQTSLRYSTDSTFSSYDRVLGTSEVVEDLSTNTIQTRSFGETILTLTERTYFKMYSIVDATNNNACRGYNTANIFSDGRTITGGVAPNESVYTQISIEDLATAVKEVDIVNTGITRVALIKDAKIDSVNGGGFAKNGWRDRDLTEIEDPQGFVNFNSNGGTKTTPSTGLKPGYWSLQPGTYKIEWSAPAKSNDRHMSRLVWSIVEGQISASGLHASASSVEGSTEYSDPSQTRSFGSKVIKITQPTWFKIMHYCTSDISGATDGFGRKLSTAGAGDPDNIYTEVRIEDLATAVKEVDVVNTGITKVAKVEEIGSYGTSGAGTFNGNQWITRSLTNLTDPKGIGITLNTTDNYIIVPAGTYSIKWSAPAMMVDRHVARLLYSSDSSFSFNSAATTDVYGEVAYTEYNGEDDPKNSYVQTRSTGFLPSVTFTDTKYIKVQHFCDSGNTQSGDAMGVSSPWGSASANASSPPIWTTIEIEDLATAVKEVDVVHNAITKIATIKDQRPITAGDPDTNHGGDAAIGPNIRKFNTLDDVNNIGITLHNLSGGWFPDNPSTAQKEDELQFATIIKVPAGTYSIKWSSPAWDVGLHNNVLQYSTSDSVNENGRLNGTVISVQGSSEFTATSETITAAAWVGGNTDKVIDHTASSSFGTIASVTFTQTTYIQLSHWCQFEQLTYGLGSSNYSGNPGDSVYAQIEIEDLATAVKEPAGSDVPVGGIIMYSGTDIELNALTNWKLCDGTTYGSVTTPNLKDKFVIGADSWSTANAGRWETNVTGSGTQSGGSKDAIIGNHGHTFGIYNGGDDLGTSQPPIQGDSSSIHTTISTSDAKWAGADVGEALTNKNLPPYFALAYIMRIS